MVRKRNCTYPYPASRSSFGHAVEFSLVAVFLNDGFAQLMRMLLPNSHVDLDAELVGAIRQLPHQFILAHAIEVGIFMLDSS